jgi:hypothetical protein
MFQGAEGLYGFFVVYGNGWFIHCRIYSGNGACGIQLLVAINILYLRGT